MSTDLYGIRVLETDPAERRVRLNVFVVYYDTAYERHEPIPEDHSFFLRVLWDRGDTRFGGGGPIGDVIDVDQILDEHWVDTHTWRFIDSVELLQTRNFPLDSYTGMSDFYYERDGRWQDEDKLVQAEFDVYVSDERYIEHLYEGMSWGSTAYQTRALRIDRNFAAELPFPAGEPVTLEPFEGPQEAGTPGTMQFSADGSRLFLLSQENELLALESGSWEECWRSAGSSMLSFLNRDDRKGIAWICYDGEIQHVWNTENGTQSAEKPLSAARYVSPQGSYFAVFGDEEALSFTDAEGRETQRLELPGYATALTFTADETYFATGGSFNEVYIYEAATATRLQTLTLPEGSRVSDLAFHPKGHLLAVCILNGPLRIYEWQSGREVFRMYAPDGSFMGPALWSPDGTYFAIQHVDGNTGYGGCIRIWETGSAAGEEGEDETWYEEELPVIELGVLETLPGRDALNQLIAELYEDPADGAAWDRLSSEYTRAGRRDMALKCYEVLTVMYPGNSKIWFNKGVLQRDSGQMQAAEESFMYARDLDPEFGAAWSELGKMHFRRNEVEEGMACYAKAIETAPSYTVSYVNLGYYLIKFGRPEEAAYYSGRGMEEGDEYSCPFNKAHAHFMMGERDKALELYVYTLTGARSEQLFVSDYQADAELFAGADLQEYEALLPRILKRAAELRGME